MRVLEALTKLVVGMSRFGDHMLSRKVSGIVVAALAFACGAGLAHALKGEPVAKYAAVAAAKPDDPSRAEVSMRDTLEAQAVYAVPPGARGGSTSATGGCSKR